MKEKVEVSVDSLRVGLMDQKRLLLLKHEESGLYLPIFIGAFETEAILLALNGIEVSRPHTHDLMKKIIGIFSGEMVRAEINELRNDTYYASLVIKQNDDEIEIDCRPTDAIALALRVHTPIYIDKEVLYQTGIRPETDIRSKTNNSHTEDDSEDLSAFSNFMDSL